MRKQQTSVNSHLCLQRKWKRETGERKEVWQELKKIKPWFLSKIPKIQRKFTSRMTLCLYSAWVNLYHIYCYLFLIFNYLERLSNNFLLYPETYRNRKPSQHCSLTDISHHALSYPSETLQSPSVLSICSSYSQEKEVYGQEEQLQAFSIWLPQNHCCKGLHSLQWEGDPSILVWSISGSCKILLTQPPILPAFIHSIEANSLQILSSVFQSCW